MLSLQFPEFFQVSENLLGSAENLGLCFHCDTRLRFYIFEYALGTKFRNLIKN